MSEVSVESKLRAVIAEVKGNENICVALDEQLEYIAISDTACRYLCVKAENLLGKNMLEVYPEITASRNHRNILKAFSGVTIKNEPIESRMGDLLLTSYNPVLSAGCVIAVIVCGKTLQ
jgi:hypothetical protein